MIIYNLTVKVTPKVAPEWLRWMKEEHMQEVIDTGLFFDSRLCHLLEQDETEGITYIVQYFCDSMENYNSYLKEHATTLREKGLKKFGDQYIAFRTVMRSES